MRKKEVRHKKLSDIDHVILKPGMYISTRENEIGTRFLFDGNVMYESEVKYNLGFIKLFDEIIINSVDESKRNKKLDTIKVNIKDDVITIWDNGGIDVEKREEYDNLYLPHFIFSNMKTGSNFEEDDERLGSGTNGVGSTIVNIHSTSFKIETADGKNHFNMTFENNMRKESKPIIKKSSKKFTSITYKVQFDLFEMNGIDEETYELLKKRTIDIAGCNPNLKIYFNDEIISIKKWDDYVNYYTSEFFSEESKDKRWQIAVGASDNGFKNISFVNSTDTFKGGTHVEYIFNQIFNELKEYFLKKHKVTLKTSDVKPHLALYINSTIVNPVFSSQTKENLTSKVSSFGTTYELSDKMLKYILKSDIVPNILDWVKVKEQALENKKVREADNKLSKLKVEKLIDAKSKNRDKCTLFIFEGDSASANARDYRDSQYQGIIPLRGKILNVNGLKLSKILSNAELTGLMSAIGLKFGEKAKKEKLRYGKIVILTDADYDGYCISALMINFLFTFWIELFEMGLVYVADTPIVIATNHKTKKKINFYTNEDFDKWLTKNNSTIKNWKISYKKGLASLEGDEYIDIIEKPILNRITIDSLAKESLEIWFGKDSDLRKKEMMK